MPLPGTISESPEGLRFSDMIDVTMFTPTDNGSTKSVRVATARETPVTPSKPTPRGAVEDVGAVAGGERSDEGEMEVEQGEDAHLSARWEEEMEGSEDVKMGSADDDENGDQEDQETDDESASDEDENEDTGPAEEDEESNYESGAGDDEEEDTAQNEEDEGNDCESNDDGSNVNESDSDEDENEDTGRNEEDEEYDSDSDSASFVTLAVRYVGGTFKQEQDFPGEYPGETPATPPPPPHGQQVGGGTSVSQSNEPASESASPVQLSNPGTNARPAVRFAESESVIRDSPPPADADTEHLNAALDLLLGQSERLIERHGHRALTAEYTRREAAVAQRMFVAEAEVKRGIAADRMRERAELERRHESGIGHGNEPERPPEAEASPSVPVPPVAAQLPADTPQLPARMPRHTQLHRVQQQDKIATPPSRSNRPAEAWRTSLGNLAVARHYYASAAGYMNMTRGGPQHAAEMRTAAANFGVEIPADSYVPWTPEQAPSLARFRQHEREDEHE